ncbi:GNAT superfamily N-acetyltransferase [Herbaspirillum sp. Sphag1AN]|uniref:GNAT family N-acetyltransferase n=1 Tax=unclassified Herbaspirillum TaxID=2624150 RepID=UPI0016189C59|nr:MULTISPECIES: GNAT family N-acetyltransferase [unclassified Herbaspirillum]MBB3211101.1 GNAT superfamily N-acetyltransferase [Herbaspirillum sp. Sphag1AN]MBB3244730.1 GNAT superfamily N-acetyltransferase [Herbaspirillum sp. Sphag64]
MTTHATLHWRAMHQQDLHQVNAIAAIVHPDYPESPEVFAERLVLSPATCWVVADDRDQFQLHGYAIAHPAVLGQPPALDTLLHRCNPKSDCLYLHDLALTQATRGAGLGIALVDLLVRQAQAHGFDSLALTAVNQSQGYWRERGFDDYAGIDQRLCDKMASYDAQAVYLTRCLRNIGNPH